MALDLPTGQGDITNPLAWEDIDGNIPPAEFQAVPTFTNYPLAGDGRYWWQVNASSSGYNLPIAFIGSAAYLVGSAALQYSVTSAPTDGSVAVLAYTTNGTNWTEVIICTPTAQQTAVLSSANYGDDGVPGSINGMIPVTLTSASALGVQVYASGGTASAIYSGVWAVALAITRNADEHIHWDYPNPFNPETYNPIASDLTGWNTDTLGDLQTRMLIRLGFANQASNPPPGMAPLVQEFLISAQTWLYRRYMAQYMRHLFRWKINPGQRFYSLLDNDESAASSSQGHVAYTLDPNKAIEWAGVQDSRNVWYPLIEGIPAQLYTMITKPWRPARYTIRDAIEVYPAPDQTYFLWLMGHYGLQPFSATSDYTTLDSELVFLVALANAKSHYGQPDASNTMQMANAYRLELIAGTHRTAHYLPGTMAVPPAVRPTLVQYQPNQGS